MTDHQTTQTHKPAGPVLLAPYGDGPGDPMPPPTDGQLLALARRALADLPEQWAGVVDVLCRRLVFERTLLATVSDYIPADAVAEDDPQAPPGWVVYVGDTLRAAGRPKNPTDHPHWALTANPRDPAAGDACDDARIGAMARGLERAFKERLAAAIAELPNSDQRQEAIDGGMLMSWPRGEDGVTLDEGMPVGLGAGELTGPAASRLEKAGLVEWRDGRAYLTERGQRAGQLHARLNLEIMDEVQREAAATLAEREV
jgi:hypothetical protein